MLKNNFFLSRFFKMPKEIAGTLFFTLAETAQQVGTALASLRSYIRSGRLINERMGRAEP